MLADGKTVALVTPDARITWLCHPRPDSAPLFAELVGGRAGGSLAVRPAHEGAPTGAALPRRHAHARDALGRADRAATTSTAATPTDACGSCACSRAAPRRSSSSRRGPTSAARRSRLRVDPDGVVVLGAADPVALYAPGLDLGDRGRRRAADGARARPEGGRPYVIELRCGSDSLAPAPHAGARAPRAHREHVAQLARGPAPARARAPARSRAAR